MSADLTFGSVPPLYREVYDIVCPHQEQVDQDLFVRLLVKSSLPKQTIMQIWETVDSKQGSLNRAGLYKALALTALAQQGKAVNDKLLESFSGIELPRPSLGDLSDLKTYSVKLRRERNPNVLGYTYDELCELDIIKVELVPEKKGLILKHVLYEVTSKKYKTTVLRRYNDFVALQELILARFPYRLVPRLPPKKLMGVDREFIEQRRKSLRRFLTLVARHPSIYDDRIFQFFLTYNGGDVQHKLRDAFRGNPDEFMTDDLALRAKDLVPMDTQTQYTSSKEHMRLLFSCVNKLRDIADRIVCRSIDYASDMLQVGKELSSLSKDNVTVSTWASGSNDTWPMLKKGFKHVSVEFAALTDKSTQEATDIENGVVERLATFQDLLLSYKDLNDRHEKGVLQDHQKALQKMGQYKKKHMSATVTAEVGTAEQLEQRILEQEDKITNMENRNYFSLYCLQMETQLIHANLDTLKEMLYTLVEVQHKAHSELAAVWETILPVLETTLPKNGNAPVSPPSSPPISPVISPKVNPLAHIA